jgi:hypothetical protein
LRAVKAGGRNAELYPGNCALNRAVPRCGYRGRMADGDEPRRDDEERDDAVREHLAALDDEIARLRRMEAALDRRIAAADEERRSIEERMDDAD